ncbi:MAG: hypothetical protein KAR40_11115 [Candidatus Sabulitectum sp.]|nr:hypothetical protein [Candidatus Sabulitectum sp.]
MIVRGFPAAYIGLYDMLRQTAIDNGYALAIHGSLAKDMDLIAAPWTDEAIEGKKLVELFVEQLGMVCQEGVTVLSPDNEICKGKKPHGRLAWNIMLGSSAYIDISIMPRS